MQAPVIDRQNCCISPQKSARLKKLHNAIFEANNHPSMCQEQRLLHKAIATCAAAIVPLSGVAAFSKEGGHQDSFNHQYEPINQAVVFSKNNQLSESTITEYKQDDAQSGSDLEQKQNPAYPILSPGLRQAKRDRHGNIDVLIRFKQDYLIPRSPQNASIRRQAIARLQQAAQKSTSRAAGLKAASAIGFAAKESFWIVNAVLGTLPLKSIQHYEKIRQTLGEEALKAILNRAGIEYIEETTEWQALETIIMPDTMTTVLEEQWPSEVRARMNSDVYRPNQQKSTVAIIDTGVQADHVLLSEVVNRVKDCSSTRFSSAGQDPGELCRNTAQGDIEPPTDRTSGHGTSSASLIAANQRMGNKMQGITNSKIDSYNAFELSSAGSMEGKTQNVLRAWQDILATDATVVNLSMGKPNSADHSSSAIAADNAYEFGLIVIASVGNSGADGERGSVASPARAHKVLGIGAINLSSGSSLAGAGQYPEQSYGPADDGRFKPDLQAYTHSAAAASGYSNLTTICQTSANTNCRAEFGPSPVRVQDYGGTSGAAPMIAGAANSIASWFRSWPTRIALTSPGLTYAYLLANASIANLGTNPDAEIRTRTGAGLLKMTDPATSYASRMLVKDGRRYELKIDVPKETGKIKAALWWPESVDQSHNNLDLFLIDPSGIVRASSSSRESIWEIVEHINPVPGQWKIRVQGTSVNTGRQEAFLTGFYR